jgi:hypothetical protein
VEIANQWDIVAHMSQLPKPTLSDSNAPFFVATEVIRLTNNGVWLSDQVEIDHEQTVRIFAKSLKRDAQGYYLQIGRETKRIEVEDTAYFVTRIEKPATSGASGIEVCLNDESRELLDPATLSYRPGRLTCRIRGGTEEARFLHSAYFDLLKDLQEDEHSYYLLFSGKKVNLASK